jgi:Domain of unknown function (DUF4286)
MIVYNVTCSMEKQLAPEWLNWMVQVHIPEVMATGCFQDFKIMKLMTNLPDDPGVNFAVQYRAVSLGKYNQYRDEFAPALQQKTRDKYGEAITAFRTLMEEIS